MGLIRRDNNELRFNSIQLLTKEGNPDYYKQLFRNAKNLFYGMQRPELAEELDKRIKYDIEKKLGAKIQHILIMYKNLRQYKSYTHNRVEGRTEEKIYKYTIESWLDQIEKWVMIQVTKLEPQIRFTTPARQFI